MSNAERRKLQPSPELIKKLTDVYGLFADEILYGSSSEEIGRKEFIAKNGVTEKEKNSSKRQKVRVMA